MKNYFNLVSQDLKNKSSLIKEYFKIHSGENGRNKEDLIVNFLRNYLPKRYSIGTGFIFDTLNNNSNQNDIIVYDSFWSTPLFPENVSQFYPIESIYGVIEVKSTLDSKELEETIMKAQKVKKMRAKGISRDSLNSGLKNPFYSIVAYDSIGLETIKNKLIEFNENIPMSERIDLILVLGKGIFYTGAYFEIVKYGQENSPFRESLGESGMELIKKKYINQIAGLELNDNALLVWYMYLMTYLSFSKDKVSNWIEYIDESVPYGKEI